MKPRHVPMRTCSGCRQERPKREMTRVVRTPAGAVVIDPTGRLAGRGAYICPQAECWRAALRTSLAHVLKTEITPADRAALEQHALSLESDGGRVPSRTTP